MKEGFVLPVRSKIAYGVGDLAINIAYTTLGFYIIFFLVNVAGLPAHWAGIIFGIARAWDAVTDYVMGTISDRTRSRYGRRRVYIITGCIPLAVTFALLWVVPMEDRTALFVYYLCITLLFNTAFTVVAVPYNAMMPELTQNYDERTSLSAYRISCTFIGNLLAAAGVAVIVDVVFGGKEHYRTGYPVMGIVFGALMAALLLVTFFGTREKAAPANPDTHGFFGTLKSLWLLREFRITLGMFLFNMIGLDIFMAIVIFFIKDVIMLPEDLTFAVMGIPLVVAVAAAPLWNFLGVRLGKKKAYILSVAYMIVVMVFFLIAPRGNAVFTAVIAGLIGVGISAVQIIPWGMLPDIIEIDEYHNGVRREGAFYGILTFLYKTASAVAVALVSSVLAWYGYVENSAVPQPDSAVTAIRLLITLGPGLCFIVSAWFVHVLPVTRERFNAVTQELGARRGGEQPR